MITGVNAGVNNAYTLGSLTASTRTGAPRTEDMRMIKLVSAPPEQPEVGGGKLPGKVDEYLGILNNMPKDEKPSLRKIIVDALTLHAINSRASR